MTWTLLSMCLASLIGGCGDEKESLSPEALTERMTDRVWSYEVWAPYPGTEQRVQEALGIWLGADGKYEQYFGFDPILTGTWTIADGPALELIPDGSPAGTVTRYPIEKTDGDGVVMRVPNGPPNAMGVATEVERTFLPSERCPPFLSRADGRYATYFLGIHTPSTQYEGWQALDFDSEGDLHVIAARFEGAQQEGFYLTTLGARCGLARYAFAPQAGAVMKIDDQDILHVAYGEGPAIYYASRPARAEADVPFEVTMVGTNVGAGPTLTMAVAPDGSVAIGASRDDARYTVFRSKNPRAASPTWEAADLPVQREAGNQLVFGISVAFDPSSRLHVAGSPNGADLAVYRDDDGTWTTLPVPARPVVGTFFEGPDAFRIDDAGRWHLVAGSIGTPDSQFGPGKPGALIYGTGDENKLTWRVVGAGGQASLDLADDGAVHLYSFDRVLGGQHTTLRGEEIERYRATARLSGLDRMTMGVGPKGRAGFGASDAVQVLLAEDELPRVQIPMEVQLREPQGARIVFPELEAECGDACSFDVIEGRWLQWDWEAPSGVGPMFASSTACHGLELTGTCWVVASDDACQLGECPPVLDVKFAASDVGGFTALVDASEQMAHGFSVGGMGPAVDGVVVALASEEGTPHSRILRYDTALGAPTTFELSSWSGARGVLGLGAGKTILLGQANASAVIGDESGFANEQVAVGLDAQGEVAWVTRGAVASMPPRSSVVVMGGVAYVSETGVTRLGGDGSVVYTATVASLNDRRAPLLVPDGERVHLLGTLRDEVSQSGLWSTRWTRLGADGDIEDEVDVPGWVRAAAMNAEGHLVMAVVLSAGQTWDGAATSAEALALAVYDAQTFAPVTLGAPDTQHFAAAGTSSGWPGMLAAGGVLRDDGSLLIAQEIQPRVVAIFRIGVDETVWDVQLGGTGAFGAPPHTFIPSGLVDTGDRIVLGGLAQGTFDFGAISATYALPTPVLVELP